MNPSIDAESEQAFAILLKDAQAGNRQALGALLEDSRRFLLSLGNRRIHADLRSKIDPLDLVQETFFKATRDVAAFHGGTPGEWVAWLRSLHLHSIAMVIRSFRRARRDLRRERSIDALETCLPQQGADPDEPVLHSESELLLIIMSQMYPKRWREVIEWRMEEELPFRDIGERLGCSEEAARKLWQRIGKSICQHLAVHGYDFPV